MRKDRLLILADFLETSVPKERFDLDSWVGEEYDEDLPGIDPETLEYKPCKTSACASGWACTIPALRKQGLKLLIDDVGFTPSYRGETSWRAVADFFGLDYTICGNRCARSETEGAELFHIFSPEAYKKPPTPKQVAKRIRDVVAAS